MIIYILKISLHPPIGINLYDFDDIQIYNNRLAAKNRL